MGKYSILLRAAFKKQKGSVIGIAFLMLLASLCLFTSVTLWSSGSEAVSAEMDRLGFGDFTAWVNGHEEELRKQIGSLAETGTVTIQPLVFAGYKLGDKYSDNEGQLIVYDGTLDYHFIDDAGKQVSNSEVLPGQIYLSPAMRSSYQFSVGDPISFELSRAEKPYEFTVAGWFEDPFMGSSMIDMKSFLISASDDAKVRQIISDSMDYDVLGLEGAMLHISKDPQSSLSAREYSRLVQTSTDISRYTEFTYSHSSIHNYMLLLQNIMAGFLLSFSVVMLVICLIIVSHSLSAIIESEQKNMAILKTMGMNGSSIRRIWLILYGSVLLGGLLLGFLPSYPAAGFLSAAMLNSTGLLISVKLPRLLIILILAGLLILFSVFLLVRTGRILNVAPIRVIRETQSGKISGPSIRQRGLLFLIALREVLSAKGRYAGICLIAALLTLFLGIIGRMGTWMGPNGEGLMNAFSVADHDLGVQPFNGTVPMDEIERAINWYSPVREKYALAMQPVTVNGQAYTANILDNADWFHVLEGEVCQFNSILITDTVKNELGLSIGDTVIVAAGGRSAEFLVSGIYQCANGMGSNIGMTVGGYARVGETSGYIWCYHYLLEDGSMRDYAMKFLQGNYRGIDVHTNSWSGLDGIVTLMHGLIVLIYVITAVFILVSVILTSSRLLQTETGTMAIYKSLGLPTIKLRLSFSLRFFMVVFIGVLLGSAAAAFTADGLIRHIFALFGIGSFSSGFSFLGMLLPLLAVTVLFTVFAWLFSSKISRVSMIRLISENEE